MPDVIEINALTGEVVERDFTPDELAQREIDRLAHEEAEAARIAEEQAREATKQSALDKLQLLGLSEEEARAIIGI